MSPPSLSQASPPRQVPRPAEHWQRSKEVVCVPCPAVLDRGIQYPAHEGGLAPRKCAADSWFCLLLGAPGCLFCFLLSLFSLFSCFFNRPQLWGPGSAPPVARCSVAATPAFTPQHCLTTEGVLTTAGPCCGDRGSAALALPCRAHRPAPSLFPAAPRTPQAPWTHFHSGTDANWAADAQGTEAGHTTLHPPSSEFSQSLRAPVEGRRSDMGLGLG